MIAEGFPVHYNLVKPHSGIGGETPGDAAGLDLADGFRWRAILHRTITREVTAAANAESQVTSPD